MPVATLQPPEVPAILSRSSRYFSGALFAGPLVFALLIATRPTAAALCSLSAYSLLRRRLIAEKTCEALESLENRDEETRHG